MRKLLRVLALVAGLALFAALAACSPEESGGAASSVYYTVTFDAQGGSEVESQSVLAGNPVRRPANPVRADHYFVGWFDEAEGGERWDFGTDSDLRRYRKERGAHHARLFPRLCRLRAGSRGVRCDLRHGRIRKGEDRRLAHV